MDGTEERYLMPHVSSSDDADVFNIVDAHGLAPFAREIEKIDTTT
jgi:hypothetical protein